MTEYIIHNGTLYHYTAGVYCGVLVTESVMRKLAALQHKHLEAVKRLLSDEADRGNVYPSMWTLHYPEGKQTNVYFIDTKADVRQRIKSAITSPQPEIRPLVFIAKSMEEAGRMADARAAFYKEGNR